MSPIAILALLALFLIRVDIAAGTHVNPQRNPPGSTITCPTDDNPFRLQTPYLWKWIGSYYNGTVDIDIKLDNKSIHCPLQAPLHNTTLPGVLSILSPTPNSPLAFLLNAWLPPFEPPPTGNNLPIRLTPPGVTLDFSTIPFFRGHTNSAAPHMPANCNATISPAGDIGCRYGNSSSSSAAVPDTSGLTIKFPSCNASQYGDLVIQNASPPRGGGAAGFVAGDTAEIVWEGTFIGEMTPWADYRADLGQQNGYTGAYKLVFRGLLDDVHSHQMVVSSGAVSWVEDTNKTREYGCVQKAGVDRIVGWYWVWVGLPALGMLLW